MSEDFLESNIFNHNLSNFSIILNESYLNDEQFTEEKHLEFMEKIFKKDVRSEEIKELVNFLICSLKDQYIPNLLLYGTKGSGKTITVFYVLSQLKSQLVNSGKNLRYIYLNANHYQTFFSILVEILFQLDNNIKRLKKGNVAISQDNLFNKIKDEEGHIIFIIDEIDKINKGIDNLLLALTKTLPTKTKAKTSLIMITNNFNFGEDLDPRVKSVLKEKPIRFKTYNALEIKEILKFRVASAIDLEKVDSGVIEKCSAFTSRDEGDCRRAIDLLINSCKIAEREGRNVNTSDVDKAEFYVEKQQTEKAIDCLTKQQQIVLLSCITAEKETDKNYTSSNTIFGKYLEVCKKINCLGMTSRRISDLVSDLDLYGLINTKIVSNGRYGRTRQIYSSWSLENEKRIVNYLKTLIGVE